jgi:hypothetical protein
MNALRFFILLGCLLPAVTASALQFRVLSWSGAMEEVLLKQGAVSLPVTAHERSLSRVYELEGTGPLQLCRERIIEGKRVSEVLATLTPPAGLQRGILVLASDETGYSGMWLDDDIKANPAGTLRIQNLSGREVALQTGGDPFVLPSGGIQKTAFAPTAKRVSIRAAVKKEAGKWERAAEFSQPVRSHFRVLVLIRNGRPVPGLTEPPAIEMISFYDFVAPSAT